MSCLESIMLLYETKLRATNCAAPWKSNVLKQFGCSLFLELFCQKYWIPFYYIILGSSQFFFSTFKLEIVFLPREIP